MLEALEPRTLLSTVIVTNNGDSGAGSLRAAIAGAAAGDTIMFDSSLMNQTITLTSGELAITRGLNLEGSGAASLTISANGASRIFDITASGNVTIAGLTITKGLSVAGGGILQNGAGSLIVSQCALTSNEALSNSAGDGLGGAIDSAQGALNVANCSFNSNNTVGDFGGAINVETHNSSPATINESTFTGNKVSGIPAEGNAFGGAVCDASIAGSTLTVTQCSFTNNSAIASDVSPLGDQGIGGALAVFSTTTIVASSFNGNVASGGTTGGRSAQGAAIAAFQLAQQPSFSLSLVRCTVTGNAAVGAPGGDGVNTFGFAASGGIASNVPLSIQDSTISNNLAMGGSLDPSANPPHTPSTALNLVSSGGGINSGATLTLIDSTVSGNQVIGGAGSVNYPGIVATGGGIALGASAATISDSTIDDNAAIGGAGAIAMSGGDGVSGGIDVEGGSSLTATNTTIAGNKAAGGAGGVGANAGDGLGGGINLGIGVIFGQSDSSILRLTNCTISGNLANSPSGLLATGGGGIHVSAGEASLFNTIAAGNDDMTLLGLSPDDIEGTVDAASANNLIGLGGSGGLMNGVNGNLVGVSNPGLGQLANNGGPTQTMALLPGSPATDAGSNALAVDATGNLLAIDQRGLPRISNGTVDIGAYEFQQTLQLVGTTVGDGTAQRSEVRSLTLRFNQPVSLSSGAVTLALLNTGGSGINNGAPPTDVSAALATPTTSDGGFTWVFTFLSGDFSAVDRTGSLLDGIYTATLHAGAVGGSTNPLTGGDQTITFHRLFGDINGDGTVSNADYFQFNKAFNSKMGDAAYNPAFDFNGDGVISNVDYFQFNKHFGKKFSQ